MAFSGTALVGHTGFVGTTLRRQTAFDAHFNSTNIAAIENAEFDRVVCCAAPAQKWRANREPDADRRTIEGLIARLRMMRCREFVLVSTVDVFSNPVDVDEASPVNDVGLHPYGLHRRMLERFVEGTFERHLIVRLPGLVGPGLRKNVVFDLLNGGSLDAVDSRSVFQFYPMINLWADLSTALTTGLSMIHVTSEPISVRDVARLGFNREFDQERPGEPARYDMRTRYAEVFGGRAGYQYSQRETVQAIRAYAQSEPTAPLAAGERIG